MILISEIYMVYNETLEHTSVIFHDIKVLQIQQFSNPRVIGEVVHCKPYDIVAWENNVLFTFVT